jgi:glycosidase
MTDLELSDVAQFRDQVGLWAYHVMHDDLKLPEAFALKRAVEAGRDKGRTPVQWANAANGGFSPAGVETWLPVNPNTAQGVNVVDQQADPGSLLNFYRRMLRLRKQTPALISGYYTPLHETAADYLAFLRHTDAVSLEGAGQTCLVVLNFSEHSRSLSFELKSRVARQLFPAHNRDGVTDDVSRLDIGPFEAYIGELIS